MGRPCRLSTDKRDFCQFCNDVDMFPLPDRIRTQGNRQDQRFGMI